MHASDPGSRGVEGLEEEEVMVLGLPRKEFVEAKCLHKYFALVCVTEDTITGPETLPSY